MVAILPLAHDPKREIHLCGRSNLHSYLGNILFRELPRICLSAKKNWKNFREKNSLYGERKPWHSTGSFMGRCFGSRGRSGTLTRQQSGDRKISGARSEKDITRVSGTLSPSSILGGRTSLTSSNLVRRQAGVQAEVYWPPKVIQFGSS